MHLYKVVGVRFKKAGKIYYFDPAKYELDIGQYIIVETARGIEYGKVVVPIREVQEDAIVLPLKQVVRTANGKDSVQEKKIKKSHYVHLMQQRKKL